MLIEEWMPRWDARERHRITLGAPAESVYAALRTADLGGHPWVRAMLALRALPSAIGNRTRFREIRARACEPVTLAAFEAQGFRVLEEDPPRELVLGLEGAFWTAGGDLRLVDPAAFGGPVPAGTARAAWNFTVTPEPGGRCVLCTETRHRHGRSLRPATVPALLDPDPPRKRGHPPAHAAEHPRARRNRRGGGAYHRRRMTCVPRAGRAALPRNESGTMSVFTMVVLIVLIGTLGKVLQSFAGRSAAPLPDGRLRELEAALRANELRLAQTEERLEEMGEKLVFVEHLLAAPAKAPELPSSRD